MIYAVKDGKFTGAVYERLTKGVDEWISENNLDYIIAENLNIKLKDSTFRDVTPEELSSEATRRGVYNNLQYLADTDWIIIKINELSILGNDTSGLIEKYKEEIKKREESRIIINELG